MVIRAVYFVQVTNIKASFDITTIPTVSPGLPCFPSCQIKPPPITQPQLTGWTLLERCWHAISTQCDEVCVTLMAWCYIINHGSLTSLIAPCPLCSFPPHCSSLLLLSRKHRGQQRWLEQHRLSVVTSFVTAVHYGSVFPSKVSRFGITWH